MNQIHINYVDEKSLKIPNWRATYVLRPDLLALSASLGQHGFIQPIHIRKSTMEVIDGSERLLLARNVKEIKKACNGMIPVVEHDVDLFGAMMLHLQLNRARGTMQAKNVSEIVRKLYMSGRYNKSHFDSMLCMKGEEFALMLDGTLLKVRKIQEHNYAKAWVPVEEPPGTINSAPLIERPPNKDR